MQYCLRAKYVGIHMWSPAEQGKPRNGRIFKGLSNIPILFQVVAVKSSNLYYVCRIPSIINKHEYKAVRAERPKSLFDRR